jgi:hypothetical protein
MKKTLLLASISALLLSACSDPKDPTKENFKAAISAAFDKWSAESPTKTQLCYTLDRGKIDLATNTARLEFASLKYLADAVRESKSFAILESLRLTGFATLETETTNTRIGALNTSVYTLNPDTVKIYTSESPGIFGSTTKHEICGAKMVIGDVISFTEPVDSPNGRVVTVDVQLKVDSPAAWLTAEPMLAAYPGLQKRIDEGVQIKVPLVLKDTGWEVRDRMF